MDASPGGRRPRILYVVNVSWFFQSHRLPIAMAARDAGYDVHVAATPDGGIDDILNSGMSFHGIAIDRSGTNLLSELGCLFSLYRLYRKLRPDIVHHVTSKPVILGSAAARAAGVPYVVNAIPGLGLAFSSSQSKAALRRWFLLLAYRLTLPRRRSKMIFQNVENQRLFTRKSIVADENAVLIKGSGVDLALFRPTPEPAGIPCVTLASRMLWDKGIGEFVEAAALLRARGVKAKFVVAGGVDTQNPHHVPEAQLNVWNSSGAVEWIGHQQDMRGVFEQTHVICLPSTYGEGVPKVLIEAAASGRPIVTTDVPGCRDIVRDEWNGILVPGRDPPTLADAIERLVRDPQLRTAMGRNGRKLVEDEFSLSKVVQETLAVYSSLLTESTACKHSSNA